MKITSVVYSEEAQPLLEQVLLELFTAGAMFAVKTRRFNHMRLKSGIQDRGAFSYCNQPGDF